MKKIPFIFLFVITCFNVTFSQNGIRVFGIVKDEDDKLLEYVNVFILNTFEGGMTDNNGNFSFVTKQKEKIELVAGMVGYKKYSTIIDLKEQNNNPILIILKNGTIATKEVIITASSFGSEKGKGVVMTNIDVLTTPGGAADIFQALKTMPGLTSVSESAELYVRGGDPIETITLLDQASLNHPYTYESSYGGLFSNINSDNITGMFFSSGGFSAKYGNALSGVLDLETKNEPLKSTYKLGVSLAATELSAAFPIMDETLGLRINGRKSFTEPIFWLNGKNSDFTSEPISKDLSANLVYKYSSTGRIKTFFSYADDKQGVLINQPGYIDEFAGTSHNYFINTQISDILFKNLVLKTSISYSKFNRYWTLGLLDLTKSDKNKKLRSDAEWEIENNKINFGFEIENRFTNFLGTVPVEDYDMRKNGKAKIIDADFNITRYGIYIETELANFLKLKGLSLVAGLRTDYISKLNIFWIDPRGNLGYKLFKNTNLAIGLGIFHQHPDPRLYSPQDGNPNLKAMRALHFVTSINYKFSDRDEIRIEAYYKKYSNLPLEVPIKYYNNDGFGYAKGIDIIAKGVLFDVLDSYVSYGLLSTKRKWMDYKALTSSEYDITHNLNIVAKYNITNHLQVGINYKFATGKPFTPVIESYFDNNQNIFIPVYGKDNSERYKNYQRLDIRFTYLAAFFENNFTVFYIEGLNILNIKNVMNISYSYDYTSSKDVFSYFGRRMIVIGTQITF
jgi:vitamin B12 transporter